MSAPRWIEIGGVKIAGLAVELAGLWTHASVRRRGAGPLTICARNVRCRVEIAVAAADADRVVAGLRDEYTSEDDLRQHVDALARPRTRVFVYGTLRNGWGNHRLLVGQTFVGPAKTVAGFAMFEAGIPIVRRDASGGAIVGEVYEVDAAALRDLDRLEGHPRMYCREEVDLADGTRAWIYLWPEGKTSPWAHRAVPSGDYAQSEGGRGGRRFEVRP